MKKTLFLCALFFIFIQSCQSPGQKKALDYNNKIANISRDNQAKWKLLGQEINAAEQSHNYSKLTASINDLTDFLNNKISEIDAIKNPPGAEDLKKATLDFLRFDKSIAEEKAKPYTQMNQQTTSEEFQTVTQALLATVPQEEPYLAKLQDAQRAFAKKNGFSLEEAKQK